MMVNAAMVNAGSVCLACAHFHGFLLVSGRFMLLKNPVKYTGIFEVNQNKDVPQPFAVATLRKNRRNIKHLSTNGA
jgi:hypothetical protein